MPDKAFVGALCTAVMGNIANTYNDNSDPYRFPDILGGRHRGVRRRLKNVRSLSRLGTPDSSV